VNDDQHHGANAPLTNTFDAQNGVVNGMRRLVIISNMTALDVRIERKADGYQSIVFLPPSGASHHPELQHASLQAG
jgi:hypothetical protein